MRIMFLFLLALCCVTFAAENSAMFDLIWGMTPKELKKAGIVLEKKEASANLSRYVCASLPKNIDNIERYSLLFDDSLGLVKVTMYSENITGDVYGTEGKERFEKIEQMLQKTYKKRDSFCSSGNDLYEESDEFYQCLRYPGCGDWASFWDGDNKIVNLELEGISRGTGYITLAVEAVPGFENAVARMNTIKAAREGDALE
jgi:hypothetical protein